MNKSISEIYNEYKQDRITVPESLLQAISKQMNEIDSGRFVSGLVNPFVKG